VTVGWSDSILVWHHTGLTPTLLAATQPPGAMFKTQAGARDI
jgi:hypothetical protein